MLRLLHPLPEAQDALGGMGRSTVYELIKAGEIAVVKVGRRTYIAHDELLRYVQALTEVSTEDNPRQDAQKVTVPDDGTDGLARDRVPVDLEPDLSLRART